MIVTTQDAKTLAAYGTWGRWQPRPAARGSLRKRLDAYRIGRAITLDSYRQLVCMLNVFERFLGRQAKLRDLNDATLDRWLEALKAAGQTPKTIAKKRENLITLWRHCYALGIVGQLPRGGREIFRPALKAGNGGGA